MGVTVTERNLLSLPHYFAELRKNIEPKQDRKDTAASLHRDVRDFLESATDYATADPHSRLTGSYSRSTAIHSIKDVDVLVFISVKQSENPDPEGTLDALYDKLKELPDALDRPGAVNVLRRQRRSIRVEFNNDDLFLDIVPAWIRDGINEPLWVPDREWSQWIKSDPLGYSSALSELNASVGEKAVPLIKLFKHWRTVQMQRRRPKSYWLESLVYRHLEKGWVETNCKSYAIMFIDLLRSIQSRFQSALDGEGVPVIPDPKLENNIAATWERPAFESLMARLNESIGWGERALEKTSDELDEAVKLWQNIFGAEYFTDSAETRRLEKAELVGRGGAIFVTGSGRVSGSRSEGGSSVISRLHHFYGEEL